MTEAIVSAQTAEMTSKGQPLFLCCKMYSKITFYEPSFPSLQIWCNQDQHCHFCRSIKTNDNFQKVTIIDSGPLPVDKFEVMKKGGYQPHLDGPAQPAHRTEKL